MLLQIVRKIHIGLATDDDVAVEVAWDQEVLDGASRGVDGDDVARISPRVIGGV